MVQTDADSLLLERSGIMVSHTQHSSPRQRGPANQDFWAGAWDAWKCGRQSKGPLVLDESIQG